MKLEELTGRLELQRDRHFAVRSTPVPVLDSHLYTTLGRRLYDLYQKYKIEKADQRELESLATLLSLFVLQPDDKPAASKSSRFWWKRKPSAEV